MYQLDDTFLTSVGLADLPDGDKQSLLRHVYEEMELRVGTKLSDGLADAELAEFEAIIERDYTVIVRWLDAHAPNFLDDPVYLRMARTMPDAEQTDTVCEYAATKWLEIKRPNYRDLVAATLEELRAELSRDAARLLGKV